MSRTSPHTYPQLTVTENPQIGPALISIQSKDHPVAQYDEVIQALIDIYSSLEEVKQRVFTPWYVRLWRWTRELVRIPRRIS